MKRAVFLLTLLCTAFLARVVGGSVSYRFFYILCAMLALSTLFLLCVFFTVRTGIEGVEGFALTGERTVFHTYVRSSFFLPVPALVLKFTTHPNILAPTAVAVTLYPGKKRLLRGSITFKRRGVYTFGLRSWRAWDYFGIFSTGRRCNKVTEVTVLPRVITVDDRPPPPPREIETNTAVQSGTELAEARPYTSADSMRSIHWKLSAKGEELYVKQYSKTVLPPVWVVTDLTVTDESLEEKLLETSLSITRHLVSVMPVRIAVMSDITELGTVRSSYAFQEHHKTLGLAEFCGTDFTGQLERAELGDEGVMWVITTRCDIQPCLGAFAANGWDVRWLPVTEAEVDTVKAGDMGIQTQIIAPDGSAADAAWMLPL